EASEGRCHLVQGGRRVLSMAPPWTATSMRRNIPITLALAVWTCALAACGSVAAEREWSFDVAPYLWVAGVELETSLPGGPPSTPSSADRFDTKISAGAMLAAQARYRSVGLFVDFAWLQLKTEARDPGPAFSAVDLKSDF